MENSYFNIFGLNKALTRKCFTKRLSKPIQSPPPTHTNTHKHAFKKHAFKKINPSYISLYTPSGDHSASNMLSEGFGEKSLSTICKRTVNVIATFLQSKEGFYWIYLKSHLLVQILCCKIFSVHMNKNVLSSCCTK